MTTLTINGKAQNLIFIDADTDVDALLAPYMAAEEITPVTFDEIDDRKGNISLQEIIDRSRPVNFVEYSAIGDWRQHVQSMHYAATFTRVFKKLGGKYTHIYKNHRLANKAIYAAQDAINSDECLNCWVS